MSEFRWPKAAVVTAASLLGVLTACGPAGEGRLAHHSDSSGVEIVRIPASAVKELSWRLEDKPVAVLRGDADADAVISGVMGAVRTSKGQILVHCFGKDRNFPLRLFDSIGKTLVRIGRQGRGPGEFQSVSDAGLLAGDSVWAYDQSLMGLSVFTSTGDFVRRSQLAGSRANCQPVGPLSDGSMVVRCFKSLSSSVGSYEFLRVASDGTERNMIAADTMQLTSEMGYHADAFGSGARYLYRGKAESYEIRVFAADGKLIRISRVALEPHVLTAEELERQQDYVVALNVAQGVPEKDARVRAQPMPSRIAVWVAMVEDPDGNLWAMESRIPWDLPRRWMVFNPKGELLGRMETPAGLQVYNIGRDYMLVGREDDDGVQLVELRRLVK
jgi:hypothetical protein